MKKKTVLIIAVIALLFFGLAVICAIGGYMYHSYHSELARTRGGEFGKTTDQRGYGRISASA